MCREAPLKTSVFLAGIAILAALLLACLAVQAPAMAAEITRYAGAPGGPYLPR
jgi:hypothetical protein